MMSVLTWDKPQRVMSKEDWKESHGFDGGPPGGYVPNMSREDELKWKAKFIGGKHPRVEVRKTTTNGTQILIVVTAYGFPPKSSWDKDRGNGIEARSEGKNVRVSQNGPAFFSMTEFHDFQNAVDEAWEKLQTETAKKNSPRGTN